MRIERVEVQGFGCLVRAVLELDAARANLVIARNEAGKSTLLAALEIALYGFPPARTAEGRERRVQFRPWAGGASRIALALNDGTHRYELTCDLANAAGEPVERVSVRRDGQDVNDEWRGVAKSPGQWLFGLERDDFSRSVLVRQGELESVARDTQQLVRHLEAVVSSTSAGVSASKARAALDDALENYRRIADLERWSQGHLERAIQWPRVAARLREQIAQREGELRRLEDRRRALAAELEQMAAADARAAERAQARACLRVLETATQLRDVSRRLTDDDRTAAEQAAAEAEVADRDDVRDFPSTAVPSMHRLFERIAQLRQQCDALNGRGKAARDAEAAALARRAPHEVCARLVDRLSTLGEQLTLFRAAEHTLQNAIAAQRDAERTLADAGHPVERVEAARACYQALTFDERELLRNLDRRRIELSQREREQEQTRQGAEQQRAVIANRRRGHRRRGIAIGVGALIAGALGAAGIALGLGAAALMVGVTLLALAVVGLALGTWIFVAAGRLEAYEYDRLRDVLRTGDDARAIVTERARLDARLDEIAQRQACSRTALLEHVQYYQARRDDLAAIEQAATRATEARATFAEQQRVWAEFLRLIDDVRSPDELPVAAAAQLHERVGAYEAATQAADVARHEQQRLSAELDELSAQLRGACGELGAALGRAGVALPSTGNSHGLPAPEEMVVARRELEQRAARKSERASSETRASVLRAARVPNEERTRLAARAAALQAELDVRAAEAGEPAAVLAWLLAHAPWSGPPDVNAWTLDGVVGEELARATAALEAASEQGRQAETATWQAARGFLQNYARCSVALADELGALRRELLRGERFAKAIGIARDVLDEVQAGSYARWSRLLAGRLAPHLAALLPNYRLASIGAALDPELLHAPTGQRLDIAGLARHLSRGAKDRLFLALRLALAEVLGTERGVRLPLLLDDPLANCDDEALADGLRALGEIGAAGTGLLIFTCQRSRCEAAAAALQGGGAALNVCSLDVPSGEDR